ncbi:MAG: GNAT family N-acetyltransferase [Rhodobacter sp.]|nr:GNAT family N-acetyltransferase [Rhodobacter sp.]
MTPAELAGLHARCFTVPRPWSVSEFETFLAAPATVLTAEPGGFALGQVVAGEAELLTIAVAPGERRQGLGRRLLDLFLSECAARGASAVFLEVDAGNAAALGLYRSAGFSPAGRRRAYYHAPDGTATDALILRRATGPALPER